MEGKATERHGARSTHTVHVLWPDCDPAGIVFYANYYRWMDDATHYLFTKIGLPFDVMQEKYGTPGVPLVASHADYRRPSKFHDTLTIESFVSQCGRSSFTISHIFRRGDELIL
jgi:YbgC/YbaW family acyl-CoA thioester hydrolase